jgi:glycosyltransferase involved in cell wall biosynthesis
VSKRRRQLSEFELTPIELGPLPKSPLVSVLVTNYNRERFIAQAIESVLSQTNQQFEIIVCDDGSTDRSPEIVASMAASDRRIRLIRLPENRGNASALNAAWREASGQIICLLDSDDEFHPRKLEKVVERFVAHPDVGTLVHPLMYVDEGGEPIQELRFLVRPDCGWIAERVAQRGGRWSNMPGGGTCFRRELGEVAFPIPEDTFRFFGDGFIYTLGPLLTPVSYIDEPLYDYRIHGSNAFASRLRDYSMARSESIGIKLQVAGVNARLRELGIPITLDVERNLNYRQQRFVLDLFDGMPRTELVRRFVLLVRMFLTDDLYLPSQKLARLLIYGIAIPLPLPLRRRWLVASRSYNGFRRIADRLLSFSARARRRGGHSSSLELALPPSDCACFEDVSSPTGEPRAAEIVR